MLKNKSKVSPEVMDLLLDLKDLTAKGTDNDKRISGLIDTALCSIQDDCLPQLFDFVIDGFVKPKYDAQQAKRN